MVRWLGGWLADREVVWQLGEACGEAVSREVSGEVSVEVSGKVSGEASGDVSGDICTYYKQNSGAASHRSALSRCIYACIDQLWYDN